MTVSYGLAGYAATQPRQTIAHQGDDHHPATLQAEVAAVPDKREDDPDAEEEQGKAHYPAHQRVDPIGQQRTEPDRKEAEGNDQRSMTKGIHRGQEETMPCLVTPTWRVNGCHLATMDTRDSHLAHPRRCGDRERSWLER